MKTKKEEKQEKFVPYEKSHKLEKMKLFVIIVPFGQAQTIEKYLFNLGVTAAFCSTGEGTGTREMYEVLGLSDSKKQAIFTIVKESIVPQLIEKLKHRFSVSKYSKGIAFSVDITSVVGVSIYKYLVNNREV